MYHIKSFDEIQRERQGIEDPKPQSQLATNAQADDLADIAKPDRSNLTNTIEPDPDNPPYGQRKPDERMDLLLVISKEYDDDDDDEDENWYYAEEEYHVNFSNLTLDKFKKLCNKEIDKARKSGKVIKAADVVRQFAFGQYYGKYDVTYVDDEPAIIRYVVREIFNNYASFVVEGVAELEHDLDNLTIEQLYNKFSELNDFLKHFEYEELDYGGKFNYETDMEDEFLAWYRDPNRDKLPVPVEN